MTVENFLKLIISKSKKYKKNKEIFDIVLYGSLVRRKRKVNDIDILFIFYQLPLKERLIITQQFKKEISTIRNIDIKTINLDELFSKNFLAKQGVLIEGISLIDNKPFSEKIGFNGFGLFSYKTTQLSNTEKVRFSYALNGRRKEIGFLERVEGKRVGNGAFLIPIKNLELFYEFLEKWKIEFKIKKILVSEYL